jgi:glycosyltransferase involved in cell wall biosynthesis
MNRKSRLIKLLRRFPLLMLETADAIVGTGRLAQQEYGRGLGFKRAIFSMPYLVNLDAFLQIERPKVRASNGVAFLACGDLIRRKGMDVLLSAFTRAARSYPNISLSVVGDGPERASLIKRVPQELTDRVRFTGRIPFADRGQPFASADVFVHSARHDGWGVVIQEALSAGLPVIATRETGAAHDLIEDGENGFLVDAEDEDGLCERMVWFAQNQDEINALGARARKSASRLTPEWGAGEIVAIARNVLGMRGPKHL